MQLNCLLPNYGVDDDDLIFPATMKRIMDEPRVQIFMQTTRSRNGQSHNNNIVAIRRVGSMRTVVLLLFLYKFPLESPLRATQSDSLCRRIPMQISEEEEEVVAAYIVIGMYNSLDTLSEQSECANGDVLWGHLSRCCPSHTELPAPRR